MIKVKDVFVVSLDRFHWTDVCSLDSMSNFKPIVHLFLLMCWGECMYNFKFPSIRVLLIETSSQLSCKFP